MAKADSLKSNIQRLINRGLLGQAEELLQKNIDGCSNDADLYALQATIRIFQGDLDNAERLLKTGLSIDSENVNLLYCMGNVFEKKQAYLRALNFYNYALENCRVPVDKQIAAKINYIQTCCLKPVENKRKKLVFLVRRQMDHFLDDIIYSLSQKYETRKVIVKEYKQIDKSMSWADICWFEWCDELIVYGSKHELACEKKIICRLHRREVFENYVQTVGWEKVDHLIVVADHLRKLLARKISDIEKMVAVSTISNGVDLDKYDFRLRRKGFHLAYICYIDARKNPALLLQIIKKLVAIDSRYKLFVAGRFVDPLIEAYWNYQVREMHLEGNVIFDGWQNNINRWLDDKEYIVSTSIHESFGYNIAEAMAIGIKPVIHDFLYGREIWNPKYLFNTVDEAVAMITSPEYNSAAYRRYVVDNFSLQHQMDRIEEVLNSI